MSVAAMTWAWKQKCPSPIAKLVLLKLADNANDAGACWPSLNTIAQHCGVARDTVWRVARQLEAAGFLRIEHRSAEGVSLPNLYHLSVDETVATPDRHLSDAQSLVATFERSPSDIESPRGGDLESPKPSEEDSYPLREPPSESLFPPSPPSARPNGLAERELDREFEEIWPLFPRRVGKGDARKAYRRARRSADRATIENGIRRFAAAALGVEARFVKTPAPWLNAERWTDEASAEGDAAASQALAHPGPNGHWEDRMDIWRHNGTWYPGEWGPPPGDPACQVPAYILGSDPRPGIGPPSRPTPRPQRQANGAAA